jgi:hypothetical protein
MVSISGRSHVIEEQVDNSLVSDLFRGGIDLAYLTP